MADAKKKESKYDLAIIGAGPAGLAASVYASRYKLSNAVIGPELGGYVSTTHLVEDYLGFETITGMDLAEKFSEHAKKFGAELIQEQVSAAERQANGRGDWVLTTWTDRKIRARAVLLATGTKHNKIGVPGEDKFEGRGVSYCVTCDAAFFKEKPVVIVGGGDSALKGALHLTEFASHLYVVHRRKDFRAEPTWVDRVKAKKNVTFILENEVTEVLGDGKVDGVKLKQPFKGKDSLNVDGVFIEIGSTPDPTLANAFKANIDDGNFVLVNDCQRTSAERVWAAGDNTTNSAMFRQIGTASAEGSVAAGDIYEHLNDPKAKWADKGAVSESTPVQTVVTD
ncbi:MAG: FAD-dependent oxidoreductase [Patescibacteria group bacterium]|nr:FAD-dependent oxidoreductase [Patescibacteria group bacterium]